MNSIDVTNSINECSEKEEETKAVNGHSDSDKTNTFSADFDSKINPEIHFKEESNGFIYKANFLGHLQLVSLDCSVNDKHPVNIVTQNCSDSPHRQWDSGSSIIPTSQENEPVISWTKEQNHSVDTNVYQDPTSISISRDELTYIKENNFVALQPQCNDYIPTLPEIYSNSTQSWDSGETNQRTRNPPTNLLTEAEKKRLYRMRLKEENPSVWSSIKRREANRKREQRERRRGVLFEMQKAINYENNAAPNSPEAEENRLYLEALKERYPELWKQLQTAIPATQLKNEQKFRERKGSSKRRAEPRQARMYVDVIEAHKKRLYRQKMKLERPDLYARQKAKDATSKSLQRFVKKSRDNGVSVKSLDPKEIEKKLTYLHNLQVEHMEMLEAAKMNGPGSTVTEMSHFMMKFQPGTYSPSLDFRIKSDTSPLCDNKYSAYFEPESNKNILDTAITTTQSSSQAATTDEEYLNDNNPTIFTNLIAHPHPTASSTQSDVLWYWNDIGHRPPKSEEEAALAHLSLIDHMTIEERREFVEKEKKKLREKRRQNRLSMSPEQREEFLCFERQRLKAYRQKKKLFSGAF